MPETPPSRKVKSPALIPPGQTVTASGEPARANLGLWLSLVAVLLVGLGVIMLLPQLIEPAVTETATIEAVIPPGTDARAVANESMQAYLQLRARLQLENAPMWGEPQWGSAEEAAATGSRMLAQRQFREAANHYATALQNLQQLEGGRERRLAEILSTASEALEDNKLIRAVEHYELALAIDADHEVARYGLARANTRITVLDNMAAAEQAEAKGDLTAAQTIYLEAAMLDPEYEPPALAYQRVTDELETKAFQNAMSRALILMDAGRLDRAGKALAEASALRPADSAVLDAQQRLTYALQRSRLTRYRKQADNQVRNENWRAAVNTYNRALGVDGSAGFALSGLEKAEARLTLNQQFDHYLKQPARLYAVEPLENAETLLVSAPSAPPNEPRLAKKIAKLERLVDDAKTPVAVSLSSDGETDVTIYHIGQLGAFTQYQFELLPGSYTVVGSRYGYRDVYKQLEVAPGKQDITLMIRCEELI